MSFGAFMHLNQHWDLELGTCICICTELLIDVSLIRTIALPSYSSDYNKLVINRAPTYAPAHRHTYMQYIQDKLNIYSLDLPFPEG